MERKVYQPATVSSTDTIQTRCQATVVSASIKKSKGLLRVMHAISLFALAVVLSLYSPEASAQVPCSWSGYSGYSDTPPCGSFTQRSVGSGTYTYLTLAQGGVYEISTCGSGFDSQLSLYDANPAWSYRAGSDDNGYGCGASDDAGILYTSTYSGSHIAIVNKYNCQQYTGGGSGQSALLRYRQIAPTVTNNGSANLCSGQTTTLTANQNYGTWSSSCFGCIVGAGGVNNTATFTAPNQNAANSVTYTVGACAVSVTINSYLYPSVTLSSPATNICVGSSNVFTATASAGSGTITNYTFRRGSSTIVQSGTSNTYTATTSGSYDVIVTQSNGSCTKTSNSITLNVNANPTTAISCTNCFSTNNFCYGSTATLNANASAQCGSIATYQWYRNGSTISGGGATYSATLPGTYKVVVANTCAPGCATTSADFVLNQNPQIVVSAGSSQTICPFGGSSANLGGSPTASGGVGPYTYSWSPATGLSSTTVPNPTATPLSTTFYTLVVTDSKGCTASSTVNITVQDLSLPTISCPSNIAQFTATGTCERVVTYSTPTFGDNCPSPSLLQTSGLASGSAFPRGVTTNVFKVTDASGNTATCSFTVTITDNEPPVITCPANITRNNDLNVCGAVVTYSGSASDNCPGFSVTVVSGLPSGSTFPVGATTVTYKITDVAGTTATCSFVVTVNDVQPPAITCPSNINQGSDGSACGGTVNYSVSATDNCTNPPTLTLVSGLSSGSLFPVGSTTVVWRARDAANNSSTCSFVVNISETTPPVITCPSNISTFNTAGICGAVVTFANPSATDNCITVSVAQIAGLASGSTFPVGVTTNTFRATDLQGNTATCSFTVTVVDNRPPQAICKNISVTLSGGGSASIVASQVDNGSNDECGVASLSITPNTFGCSNVGANTVTLTVTDVNGNSANCTSTVTVIDGTPPVAACKNLTIQLDAGGSASITPAQLDNGSSDACGISLSASMTTFGCGNVGNNTVTLTVTDPSGNATTCTSTVTVQDITPPVALCKNITVQLNVVGTVTITPGQVDNGSNDACGVSLTVAPSTFGCSNTGANTVTLTVKDPSLNTTTCTATVTVQDITPPVAVCEDITIQLDVTGNVSIAGVDVDGGSTDACGIALYSVSPSSFTCANVGPNAVTLTVTDTKGNSSTCGAVVTVQDVTLPNAICQNITLNLDASGNGSITAAQVNNGSNDACGIQSLAVFPSSFDCGDVGGQQVVLTVTDVNNNQNTCIATVTVQDLVPPVALCQSYTLELDFAGTGTVTPANIDNGSNDACGIQYLGVTGTSSVGSYTNAGGVFYNCNDVATSPHTITLVVTDVNNNTSTCVTSVTVIDNIPPVVECNNVTKNNDPTVCQAFVSIPAITILDNCLASGITSVTNSYTGTNNASGTYPVGTTAVTWTVTDAFNNTSTCTFIVTVVDNEPPTFDNPINTFTVTNPGVCYGSIIIPTLYNVNDNCGVASVVNSYTGTNNASGNYPEGISVVLWTVTDIHGNVTTKPQFIAVIDFENPTLVAGTCPGPITQGTDAGVCEADVTLTAPSYTDNCGVGLVFATVSNVAINGTHDDFPVGTTTVVWKAQDINGNFNQVCSQTITVVDDDAPAITCPANITKNADLNVCNAVTSVNVPVTSDNCGVQGVTNNYTGTSNASGTYPVGTTTVVYTVTDIYGNTTTCSFTVTVNDNQVPAITCPADVVQAADAGVCEGAVTVAAPTTSDNCAVDMVINDYTGSDDASATYPVGTTTVTWIVLDVNGNVSQCEQTITINDEEAPSIGCSPDQSQSVDAGLCGATVSVAGPTSGDNCAVDLIINDYNGSSDASDYYPVGTTMVTWIVLDVNGNVSQCEQFITVVDDEVPAITCAPAQTHSVDAGVCEANVTVVSPAYSDNCAVDLVINDYTGTDDGSAVYPVGTTTLTWIVLDIYGNVNICTQDITVVDDEDPSITCAPNQTQTADAGVCQAAVVVVAPATGDNCGVADLVNDYNGAADASDIYPVGTTTLVWTVTDIYGNSAQCTQTITVTDDELPSIICSNDQTQTADAGVCEAAVTVGSPLFSDDNCGVASVLNDYNGGADASDTYPVGTTVITWTVTDIHGNSAQCTQSITITDDELPVVTCAPNQSQNTDLGSCDAAVTVVAPATSDNCAIGSVVNDYNGTSDASDTYPVGTTTITWTVTDIHGNSTQCTQNVTIADNENPAITCAPNQTQTADAGACGAAVVVVGPATSDNCGVASVVNDYNNTADASGNYIVGTTTVIWTVTDVHGNSSQCTQTITVTDDEDPLVSCPPSMVVNTDPGVCQAAVTIPVPATADNCGVASLVNSKNGLADASGIYTLGTTSVTWTVTDIHGNSSSCSITVTVRDTELPAITCPPNTTVDNTYGLCTGTAVINLPAVSDNCAVAGYSNDYNGTVNSSDVYPVGVTPVIYTVNDVNGNSNSCSFTVTVNDVQAPFVSCPSNLTQTADPGVCEAYVVNPEPATSDNCGMDSIVNNYNNKAVGTDIYPVGTTTLIWTAVDVNGNTTTCTQTVTVTDNEYPSIICAPNQTQSTDAGVCEAAVIVVAPNTSDNCGVASVVNDYNGTSNASDVYPIGTTTIEWTVTDIYGHQVSCLQDVTIVDTEAPAITCPSDVLQTADPAVCFAAVFLNDPVTSDNCGVASYVNNYNNTNNASASYAVGTTTVIYTVTDVHGNASTCSFIVTITDDEAPVLTCPASRTQTADAGVCEAFVSITDGSANDNCGVDNAVNDYNNTDDATDVYPVGTTTVTFTVTDIHGNTSTCSFNITITDNEAPSITCPANITQTADAGECEAGVSVSAPVTGDNCGVAGFVNNYNGTADASDDYPVGTTTVVYTVTDIYGNTTTCNFTVTITDNEIPSITCPADITQTADPAVCNADVYIADPVTGDNCAVDFFINDYTGTDNATANYIVGTTTVNYTIQDIHGNTNTCSFTVTITDDELPTIICPSNVTQNADPGVCTADVSIPVPVTADNCGVAYVLNNYNFTDDATDTYPVGVTVDSFFVGDIHDNWSACAFTVTIIDDELPQITCPADIIQTADAGLCEAAVSIPAPLVSDNCVIASVTNNYNGTSDASGIYQVGVTVVMWTVVDTSGNLSDCAQSVLITDDEDPTITCPANITQTADAGQCNANVTVPAPVTADNCAVAGWTNGYNGTADASDNYPVGTTSVGFTVVDESGNYSTCSFTITITDDEAPVITCIDQTQTADPTVCEAYVVVAAQPTSDNCAVAGVNNDRNNSNNATGIYPVGTTQVVWTVTDVHGNTSSCTQNITVTDDEVPVTICQDITIQLDAGTNNGDGSASITTGDIDNGSYDNCGIASYALDETDFDCSEVGPNTVVLTVTDIHGNTNTCSATVTVEDNVAPVALCQDVTIQLDAGTSPVGVGGDGAASITTGDIDNGSSDNCGVASLALDETDFDCSEVGANTVVLTVTDVNGNTTTCTATVTVEDNVAPDARCQDVTIQLDAGTSPAGTTGGGAASITTTDINNNSTDNCTIASLVLDETDFDCSEVGVNTVVLTVTDVNGNSSTCSATVTVEDNVAPDARCHDITINLPRTGPVGIVPGDIDNNSTDNCGIASLSVAPNSFLCTDKGDNTVVLTVTDVNGNVSTCTATVTVTTDPLVITELSSPTFNCGYNISCNGNTDGSVALEVIGGCLPYTYIWSNGATTEDLSGLAAGTYDVTITDANGDNITGSITLTEPDLLVGTGVLSEYICGYNVSCHGANDGSIDVTVTGGCAPYTYTWTTIGGSGLTPGQEDQTGLTKGIYRVLIKDQNNCSKLVSFQLTQPDELVVTDLSSPTPFVGGGNISCNGANDGSINLDVDGGAECEPYTYVWSGPDSVITVTNTVTTTATVSGKVIASSSGSYGSSSSDSKKSSSKWDSKNKCGGGDNCNISYSNYIIGAPDNNGGVFYSIGDHCVFELEHEIPAGTVYTIKWRQKPYQSGTSSMKVLESSDGVLFAANAASPANTTNETYFNQTFTAGAATRYIWLEAAASPDFQVDAITYSFVTSTTTTTTTTTTGGPFTANIEDLTGLWAGTYCVTVTDANGCSLDTCITLTQPDTVETGICNDQTVLFGYYPENVAQITTSATGGSGTYSYLWSTGETTASITVAPTTTTTYTVTITDQNGCVAVESSTVTVVDVRCGTALDRVSMCNTSNKNQCVKLSDVPSKLAAGWKLGGCGGGSQEVLCSNGIDDDGNGKIDCADPACWITNACGGVNPDLSNGDCGAPTIGGCACVGGVKSYTVQYNGTGGVTINAYSGTGHTGLLASFAGVANGQLLTVNAPSGTLGTYTYFEIVGSGDVAVFTGCGSYTISGDVDQVTSQTGVSNSSYAIGSPNSWGALLNDAGDVMVLRLEAELPAGKTYKIYWRKSGSGTASMTVSESSDNIGYTQNGSAITTTNTYYFTTTITAGVATKYVKIVSNSNTDFYVDAVTYSYNVTQGVGLVSGAFTTTAYTDALNSTCSGSVTTCDICDPSGYVKLMAVKYYGPSNATVRVRDYPGMNVFQTFYGVQNGDELVVNGTFNGGNLDYITYLEIVGQSGPYANIPTDCNNGAGGDLIGRTYGSFKVTGLTDNKNNACNMDAPCDCDGGISYLGLIYNGPAGGTVSAYAKSGHQSALGTFGPLQPGDSIVIRSDAADLYKFNNNTYFEVEGFTPDIIVPTTCGTYLENVQFGSTLTVYGWIDKEGNLCNMEEQPVCPCYNGVKEITIEYDEYDSLTLSNATVLYYSDALHTDTIAVFEDVDVGDVMTVWAGDLPGGVFPNITYVQITAPPFYTVNGNASAVVSSSGVSSASNTLGAPNSSGAFFSSTGNNVVLDLGNTLPAGTSYQIYWRRSGSTGTASMNVFESADGIGFTQNGGTVTTTSGSYVTATLTTAANTRFVKIVSASSTDFYVDAIAYTYTVNQSSVARPDIKFKTNCAGLEDLVGETVRELFVQGIIDGDGNVCDNSCGVGRTLMCHVPRSHGSSWSSNSNSGHSCGSRWHHYNHNYNNHGGGNWGQASVNAHTHCVKNKDVNRKLQTGDWTLGPCPATAKPEELVASGEEGFLLTAAPNPFNESTTISFRMTAEERINVTVYNVAGEEIARLYDGVAEKDKLYQMEFRSEMNPDGMYFFRLVTESGDVYIRKLIQTKQ